MASKATRKSPQSTVRPSYSPITMAGRSALDACIDGPPLEGGGGQEQQAAEADQRRPEAGGEQRDARSERPDDQAAEGERAELGAVAGAVVGGERAAAQRLGHALVGQRAQQHVLDAVGGAAEGEAEQRRPQHR